ncbi:MAG: hypothetical protein P4N60_21260, partial [Verrucomicrobiae bacterium]|nr:hypothetical protein [Verrucomicrobiae bacterium]
RPHSVIKKRATRDWTAPTTSEPAEWTAAVSQTSRSTSQPPKALVPATRCDRPRGHSRAPKIRLL